MKTVRRLAPTRALVCLLIGSMAGVASADQAAKPEASDENRTSTRTELPLPGTSSTKPDAAAPNRSIVVDGLGRLPQFSHATVAGDLIFVSGTLGTVGTGFELAPGGTGPETKQTLENIRTILRASGADLSDVVKVSVYLADMSTFPAMNKAYSEFFGDDPPARITVGGAALALGAAVEIECIARVAASR